MQVAQRLNLPVPKTSVWSHSPVVKLPDRKPQKRWLRDVEPDGNCLPRAISVAITGSEDSHDILRTKVTQLLRAQGEDSKRMDEMAQSGKWMTEREIKGFAELLGVPVYSCAESSPNKWHYYRFASYIDDDDSNGAVYIANIPTNVHFQVVIRP